MAGSPDGAVTLTRDWTAMISVRKAHCYAG